MRVKRDSFLCTFLTVNYTHQASGLGYSRTAESVQLRDSLSTVTWTSRQRIRLPEKVFDKTLSPQTRQNTIIRRTVPKFKTFLRQTRIDRRLTRSQNALRRKKSVRSTTQ